MNQGRRGARAENAVADELRACGYDVIRSAASKGAADLVAVHDAEIVFVQVKLAAWERPYTQLSPAERRELLRVAGRLHPRGTAVVAQRIPGSGPRPALTMWYQLTGTAPADRAEWIPRNPEATGA